MLVINNMARYKCPISTCNVNFTGAAYDIAPQAIGHASGSHKMDITEDDVYRIIELQANPNFQETPEGILPSEYKVDLDSWWKKISN